MKACFDKTTIKEINQYFLPALVGIFTQLIFGLLDSMIVGRISLNALASIGLANNIHYIFTGFMGTLSVAFHILMAQNIQNNKEYCQALFSTVVNISIFIGIGYIVFIFVFGNVFIGTFFHLEERIEYQTVLFLKVTSITLLLNMFLFIFSSYFKNIGYPKVAMQATLIATLVNIFFDYALTFGKFGLPKIPDIGVGVGTIIGLTVGLTFYLYKYSKVNQIKYKLSFDKTVLTNVLNYFFPLMGQDFLEGAFVSFVFISLVANISTEALATYNLLNNVLGCVMFSIFAYSGVAQTLIARNISDNKKIISIFYHIAVCSFVVASIFAILLFIFQKPALHVLTNQINIINQSSKYIYYICFVLISNSLMQNLKYTLQAINSEKFVLYYNFTLWSLILLVLFFLKKFISLEMIYTVTITANLIITFGYYCKFYYKSHKYNNI